MVAEVDRDALLAELREQNPRRPAADLTIYVDALLEYRKAQANIDANGPIVFHPRTGAPIENPFLRVRDRAAEKLRKLRLRADGFWEA